MLSFYIYYLIGHICKEGITVPIIQVRKWRHRGVRRLAEGVASKWQTGD